MVLAAARFSRTQGRLGRKITPDFCRNGKEVANDIERKIAVVIPAFRVRKHILGVLESIPPDIAAVYVIDDCCPEMSGDFVELHCNDPRVRVVRNAENMGVGGAVIAGYLAAISDGMEIAVKIDGDGQMDPSLILDFVGPILNGYADYTKGNRFFDIESVRVMPKLRLFGNAVLSFMTKLSSGYWDIFDPTNGYTAIHLKVASRLPLHKISRRYFFETDMLFRLNTLRAVVIDIPMEAKYEDEVSNLKISRIIGEFLLKHVRNFGKRIFYNYYLRDMSAASVELPVGVAMLVFGLLFGVANWIDRADSGTPTPVGTVMIAALPVLLGIQFILAFLVHDAASMPTRPFHTLQHSRLTKRQEET